MKLRPLLIIALLTLAPSALTAHQYPDPPIAPPSPAPPVAAVIPAPAARPAVAPVPRTLVSPEPPQTPPVAPEPAVAPTPAAAPEPLQTPPVAPKPAVVPTPAAAPAPPTPPRSRGQMINVLINVTLSDTKGSPKILSMTVADGENGMNRTTTVGQGDYSFNADAQPSVVGNRIRLRLTADAVVPVDGERPATGPMPRVALRQSQTVVLNDAESVEIARAADPTSDRAFTLTVKATIQR